MAGRFGMRSEEYRAWFEITIWDQDSGVQYFGVTICDSKERGSEKIQASEWALPTRRTS